MRMQVVVLLHIPEHTGQKVVVRHHPGHFERAQQLQALALAQGESGPLRSTVQCRADLQESLA